MISKKLVEALIAEKIDGTSTFVVSLTISASNQIHVLLDDDEGLSIDRCVELSRQIEHNLDRESEDFELSVSSPGLDKPLMVQRQYPKNIGRTLKVTTVDGQKVEGELKRADENVIVIQTKVKERIEGRKKKEWVITDHEIAYASIDQAKVVIKF